MSHSVETALYCIHDYFYQAGYSCVPRFRNFYFICKLTYKFKQNYLRGRLNYNISKQFCTFKKEIALWNRNFTRTAKYNYTSIYQIGDTFILEYIICELLDGTKCFKSIKYYNGKTIKMITITEKLIDGVYKTIVK